MKKLIAVLTITLLLTGCGNPTEQEEEYPKRSDTWLIESPTEADWIGTDNKSSNKAKTTASTDTIYIEQPGDFDLKMWNDEGNNFVLKLNHGIPQDSINPAKTKVKLPGAYPDSNCEYGCYTSMYPMANSIEFNFEYHCDDVKNNNIIFTFNRPNDTPYRVANFKTNGFKEAVETVANCN